MAGFVTFVGAIGWHVLDRFRFGSHVAISPHGLGIAVGYLSGATIFIKEARKRGYPEDVSSRVMFWALIGTIVGARVAYIITHLSQFKTVGDILGLREAARNKRKLVERDMVRELLDRHARAA